MHYKFPEISHICDILPAIENASEFIVAEKENFKVINYLVSKPDTFPEIKNDHDSLRRECRGLIFSLDGKLIARRLHKFFNINEKEETQFSKIDFEKKHIILEKLDGSMITPIPIDNHIRWGTKMGITDVAINAETFVAHNPSYEMFARDMINQELTPIFEWCSRKNKIVVDYPQDRLVLIAVRHNKTGEYFSYEVLKKYGKEYNLDVVTTYPGNIHSMEKLIEETKELKDSEGWVIRFEDGHMLKIKGEWYLKLHKTKNDIDSEKNVLSLIISNQLDDLKPFMLNEDKEKIETFEKNFWRGVRETEKNTKELLAQLKTKTNNSKKEFALEYSYRYDKRISVIIFAVWDERKNMYDVILETIKKNLSTQEKINNARFLWGEHKWNYSHEE